jgi:hypothetical protein
MKETDKFTRLVVSGTVGVKAAPRVNIDMFTRILFLGTLLRRFKRIRYNNPDDIIMAAIPKIPNAIMKVRDENPDKITLGSVSPMPKLISRAKMEGINSGTSLKAQVIKVPDKMHKNNFCLI